MKYSQLFPSAQKETPSSESQSYQLLIRGGYIHKEAAGLYSFLPLGIKVLSKIQNIIREEMSKIGMQELSLPCLSPISLWEQTGRQDMNILYQLESRSGQKFALNPTTEEVITPLVKEYVRSYRDLPVSVFQINNKFRDELRAKSGILRGREFNMKDGYSFHINKEELDQYYEIVTDSYYKIYDTLGILASTVFTYASGGDFSKYSHEFQTICDIGEDTIHHCEKCNIAINKEIIEEQKTCPKCNGSDFSIKKAVEVGNIFKLGSRFSQAFDFKFSDKDGSKKFVEMGCYGIGPTRTMGTIVELNHDKKGITWPESISPFDYSLVLLGKDPLVKKAADELYARLTSKGKDVLYEDRENTSNGEKLNTADLLGVSKRIVMSNKLGATNCEYKKRRDESSTMVSVKDLVNNL